MCGKIATMTSGVRGQRSDWSGDLRKTTVAQRGTSDNLVLQNTCIRVHTRAALTVLLVSIETSLVNPILKREKATVEVKKRKNQFSCHALEHVSGVKISHRCSDTFCYSLNLLVGQIPITSR